MPCAKTPPDPRSIRRRRAAAATLALILLAAAGIRPAAAQEEAGSLRYTVTVAELRDATGGDETSELAAVWDHLLRSLLQANPRLFVLAGDAARREAMAVQDETLSAHTAHGERGPAGGQMAVAQLLVSAAVVRLDELGKGQSGGLQLPGIGHVGRQKERVELDVAVSVVDTSTGQIVASTLVTGASVTKGWKVALRTQQHGVGAEMDTLTSGGEQAALRAAAESAAAWLAGDLPSLEWRGDVLLVENGRVYVNRGRREGVRPGITFVAGERKVLRSPDTGEVLHEAVEELARLRVTEVEERVSICDVVSGDAALLHDGHAVRLP